ncbi:MAG: helix-turn-helix domain-containing protein [Dactylosporangium sp.]|nr:helix-turn-helix domain-containing protein [Dactylosporangium sp.]NNJ63364.1 helix-turn-helix domain-containing protein [Dactylosporangium sp.]
MARASGPTIARWQLGAQLKALREAATITHRDIATELGCSESKIYKIEAGDVGMGRSDLLVMLGRYGVAEEQHRETLLSLQKQGKERGWWAQYGQLPGPYSMFIGLESAAVAIRNFELAVMPGLLQTEAYTRALFIQQRLNDSTEELDRRVKVRLARQAALADDPPLQLWAIIDESALHRRVGGAAVMRNQLAHLITMSEHKNINIQVLPFSEGAHPGTLGSIAILEFPEDVHLPVAYVETFAGDVYLEREDDMARVVLAHTHLHSSALSPAKSQELIAEIARDLA